MGKKLTVLGLQRLLSFENCIVCKSLPHDYLATRKTCPIFHMGGREWPAEYFWPLLSFARGFKFRGQCGPSILGSSAVWGSVKAFVSFDLENWAAGGKHVMWLFSPKWCGFHMFYFWKWLTNSRSEFIRWFYQDGRVYSTWKPVFQLFL